VHQSLGVVDRQGGLKAVVHADHADLVLCAPNGYPAQGVDLIRGQLQAPLDVEPNLGRSRGRCSRG
jgi:hypothetical protein